MDISRYSLSVGIFSWFLQYFPKNRAIFGKKLWGEKSCQNPFSAILRLKKGLNGLAISGETFFAASLTTIAPLAGYVNQLTHNFNITFCNKQQLITSTTYLPPTTNLTIYHTGVIHICSTYYVYADLIQGKSGKIRIFLQKK